MGTAPTGTVTFVFTDIEGSTALLEELGASHYAELLAEHHRVCRGAWSAHDGFEVDTAGDAFCVAFGSAGEALAAAAQAQAGLAGLGMRVRMGVHTGDVLVADTGYVGIEVHRAARIAAAAHGGQVVVSGTTAALTHQPLRDLGEHRFKDLRAPERVFQLGDGTFPPLRSLYRSNLPVPATAFLGRATELADLLGLLGRGGVHLVTLTGPGGTGKTRLALQSAADASDGYPGGVYWVPLAPLRNPEHVLPGVARALGLDEAGGDSLLDALALRIGGHSTILLLDNAEHLLPGVAVDVAELAGACPALTLLVTSRERLQLAGEHVYPVPSLEQHDATELFVARARQLDPSFAITAAVPELCRLLDDLPLALELAAARTAVFSPEQLLKRIGGRLDLLRGGRDTDPRQQTLRATIDWSHELLNEGERQLFRRLSAFPAGCTFEEAEQVAGADPDTLQSLLDKSLVRRRETETGPRYWLLETIREYAHERLEEAGEHDAAGERLTRVYLAFAHDAEPGWYRGDGDHWGARFSEELPNIRATLRWAVANRPTEALAITAYLGYCWQLCGLFPEMLQWVDRASDGIAGADADLSAYTTLIRAVALYELGQPGAEEFLRTCLPLLEQVGRPHYHAFLATYLAPYVARSDPAAAEELLRDAEREALTLVHQAPIVLAQVLHGLADLAADRGDQEEALGLLTRVVELDERSDALPGHRMVALLSVADHLLGQGDAERAEPWLRQADEVAEKFGSSVLRERASLDIACSVVALLRHRPDEAERRLLQAREVGEMSGRLPVVASTLLLEAGVLALRGDVDAARDARRRAKELLPDWSHERCVRAVERLILDPVLGPAATSSPSKD